MELPKALQLSQERKRELEEVCSLFLFEYERWSFEQRGGLETMQALVAKRSESASVVRSFLPTIISGSLQTEAYAESVFKLTGQRDPAVIERGVALRMERQRSFKKRRVQQKLVVLEASLYLGILPAHLMSEQLRHLLSKNLDDSIELRIIPFMAPQSGLPFEAFTIYDRRLVEVGTAVANHAYWQDSDVEKYERLFSSLFESAVGGARADAFIDRAAAIHESGGGSILISGAA